MIDYEKQKRRVRKFADKWHDALGLGWWAIDIVWEYDSTRFKDDDDPSGRERLMFVTTQWEYMCAAVHVNVHLLPSITDDHLEKYLLHEYAHIILGELEKDVGDFDHHEDRVATMLANAFRWTWDVAFKAGERKGKRELRKELRQ